ncbi:ATP-binding protein [Streptomyces pseudovenezuelae]
MTRSRRCSCPGCWKPSTPASPRPRKANSATSTSSRCQDEITRRESVALERRLRRAKFEQQATLEGFDFTASSKLPAAQIRDLAALRWLHSGGSRNSPPSTGAAREITSDRCLRNGASSVPQCRARGPGGDPVRRCCRG